MVLQALSREKVSFPAVVIAGTLCIVLSKGGPFVIFFLIPLSFVCFRHNPVTAWITVGFASGINLILTLMSHSSMMMTDFVYFAAVTAVFTWVNAPVSIPGISFPLLLKKLSVSGSVRFVAGSVIAALVFVLVLVSRLDNEVVYEELVRQLNVINSLYGTASQDAEQRVIFGSLTPEIMIETVKALMLHGGALVFSFFVFWMNRQAGIFLTRFTRVPYTSRQISGFRADSRLIWVLSLTIILILLFRFFYAAPLEILLWNILTLCVILYLAQGLGILQYLVSRPVIPPFFRLLLSAAFIFLLFSPGLNMLLLGMVILLGITETWVSIRHPKQNGPSSTPEAGDDYSSRN